MQGNKQRLTIVRQRYELISSGDIHTQRILEYYWPIRKPGYIQPRVVVLKILPSFHDHPREKKKQKKQNKDHLILSTVVDI